MVQPEDEQAPIEETEDATHDAAHDSPVDNNYLKLRRLLLGDDYSAAINRYISKEEELERVSEVLPDALKSGSQKDLGDALAPVIDQAIGASIEQNPTRITAILFPIMGPAIRKAVASALAEMVQSLNNLLEQSLTLGSLNWRFRAWRAGIPYAKYVLLETIQYRVEQVLLVHRETGLLLNSVSAAEVDAQDPELVSSMLTAISDFVSDSFSDGQETLERVRFGDLELQLFMGPFAILAVAVRGKSSDELALRANTTIESIHARFAYELNHFEGDKSSFETAEPILSECLLTQKNIQGPKRKPWLAIAVLLATSAYFINNAISYWQVEKQFESLEQAIKLEPGYIIISTDRQEKRLLVTALRGDGSRSVELLKRFLLRDKSIELDIDAKLMHLGPLPKPVVKEVVVKKTVTEEDKILQLVARLQNTKLYFEPNESRLSKTGILKIPALVNDVLELERYEAEKQISDLQIILMGFADRSGSSSKNSAISKQRAEGIKNMLQENAVSSDIIVAWGVGNIDRSTIPEESQRRVTLQVLFSESTDDDNNNNSPLTTGDLH